MTKKSVMKKKTKVMRISILTVMKSPHPMRVDRAVKRVEVNAAVEKKEKMRNWARMIRMLSGKIRVVVVCSKSIE